MRLTPVLLVAALSLLVSACGHYTTVRHSAGYEKALQQRSTLLLLPTEATVTMVDAVNKSERMYDYEYHLGDIIDQELANALQNKGYHVEKFRRIDIYRAGLSHKMVNVRHSYDEIRKELYKQAALKAELAFDIQSNLGRRVVEFGDKAPGDVLVLTDYYGSSKTNGARVRDLAMDLLLGTNNTSMADASTIYLALVDAKTGDLLWSNMFVDVNDVYSSAFNNMGDGNAADIRLANQMVSEVLKPLPNKAELTLPRDPK